MRIAIATLVWFSVWLPGVGVAQPDSTAAFTTASPSSLNLGWLLLKTAGSLLLIIGLIIGTVFVIKKYFRNHLPGAIHLDSLQILARLPLQQKQSLALIKVFERIVLVGITESSITLLSEYTDAQEVQKILAALRQPSSPLGRDTFFGMMKKEMDKK